MNFQQLTLLANGFGEIARGCKKIRRVLLSLADSSEPPVTPEPTGPAGPIEPPSEPNDSIEIEDFVESARTHLVSKKMVWGKGPALKFFKHMVRQRLRANNMKFVWMHTGGSAKDRKSWKKISTAKADDIYARIRAAWEDLKDEISSKAECPAEIPFTKWSRRGWVLKAEMPEKLFQRGSLFKQHLIDNHNDLPSLK